MTANAEIVVGACVFGVLWTAATAWRVLRAHRRDAALRHARATVEAAGFQWQPLERTASLCHRDLPIEARLEIDEHGALQALTVVVDQPPLPLDAGFERQGIVALVAQDLEIGEPRFDDHVRVTGGDPLRLQSLLMPATRDAIAAAVARGATLHDGRWRARFLPGHLPDGRELARAAKALAVAHAELAGALRDHPTDALIRQARTDRTASVRKGALELLIARRLAQPELLTEATRDLDPGVRLVAAESLGFDGRPTLLEMTRTASRTWRVRAAVALARPPLSDEELGAVHEALIGALDDAELANTAATILGRIGDSRALAPLRQAAEAGPARAEAAQALAAIRARLVPGTAGLLSLAEPAGGELSQVEDTGGGLGET